MCMFSLVCSGYLESCREIVSCAKTIQRMIREQIPELYILGNPAGSTFAFGSKAFNVLEVGDAMSRRGWSLNALGDAAGVHIACTVSHCSFHACLSYPE